VFNVLRFASVLVLGGFSLFSAPARNQFTVYLGGSRADAARAIAVDADGNSYVAGQAFRNANRPEAFVAKTSADGSRVLWTTYLTGESAVSVAIDAGGNVWVGSGTALAKLNGADGRLLRTVAMGGL